MLTGTSYNCYLTFHDFAKQHQKYVMPSPLNNNEREYNYYQSLNMSYSERCLNIGSVSFVGRQVYFVVI